MSSDSGAKQLMGYSFLVVFANDGTVSEEELKMLERIALEDKVVDEDEKRILKTIFSRAEKTPLSTEVSEDIKKFRQKYSI
ncbi:MAG TPA: hypothetical protein PKC29_02125 [Thermodesulfobacteriota bacterium]|nr:hypothetical protein [Thermodesulfobacteriota bacterium]